MEVKSAGSLITFYLLLLASALLLLAAHFLPWAAHTTSALTRSAHELAVMTNFTPGAGIFLNEWFLLPLWSAALLFALACSSAPPLLRALASVIALVIASLGFPTYPQVLTAYANPDYSLQFFITLAVLCAIVTIAVSGRRLSRFVSAIALGCGLVSTVPLLGYLAVKPFIEALYGSSVGLGVGWWVTLVAVVTIFVAASATILQSSALKRPRA